MRRAEVTDEDILAAGKRLLTDGKDVNANSLRIAVGERGRPERLFARWSNLKDSLGLEASEPGTAPPPSHPLPERLEMARVAGRDRVVAILDELFSAAWRTADDLAEGRRAEERAAAKASVERLDKQLFDANGSISASVEREEALENRIDELEVKLSAAEAFKLRLTAQAERDNLAIADLTERTRLADAAASQASQKTSGAIATADAAQAEAERSRIDVGGLRRDLDVIRTRAEDTAKRLATAETKADGLDKALKRESQARMAAEARADETVEKLTTAVDRAARAEQRVAALQAKVDELCRQQALAPKDVIRSGEEVNG